MKIADIQQQGGFVSSELVHRTATWNTQDGQELSVEFFVRRAPFGAIDRVVSQLDKSQSAGIISECIRLGDEGEETLTYEQAYALDSRLAAIFAEAVTEVNRLNDELPKD